MEWQQIVFKTLMRFKIHKSVYSTSQLPPFASARRLCGADITGYAQAQTVYGAGPWFNLRKAYSNQCVFFVAVLKVLWS